MKLISKLLFVIFYFAAYACGDLVLSEEGERLLYFKPHRLLFTYFRASGNYLVKSITFEMKEKIITYHVTYKDFENGDREIKSKSVDLKGLEIVDSIFSRHPVDTNIFNNM